ncbi:MAG: single-stranded DNA-binding protein [Candidatus Daviesbacteria bacterium]|nr:single-stranded DNA-binding protein [Candidatus Daviesbacteria bacterium]
MASRSWNRVELIGNLTRDPELRYTPNGAAVVTFGIATNRTYVTDGEKKEEVDFHKLVAWNKLAELCNQLLKKGMRVFVSGRLQTRSWEAQDGTQRQSTEIVLEDMIILTPKTLSGPVAAPEQEQEVPEIKEEKKPARNATHSVAGGEVEEKKPEEKAPQEEVTDDLPF